MSGSAGAVALITVSMLGVAAIALFLSTVTDSVLGAAFGALAALVGSEVLVTLNAAVAIQPYLPTRYWLAWIDFFRQPIFWRDIQRGFGIQAVYVAGVPRRGLGQLRHQGRDGLALAAAGIRVRARAWAGLRGALLVGQVGDCGASPADGPASPSASGCSRR